MDTELARTFLVVIATGSFVEAAQRLHVTQSTVSTRIQRLEETLGAELFVRNKAGTTLTRAGQQFQRHAALLTRTVEQARHEIGIVSGFRATLTIGCRMGLWEDLLLRWLPIFGSLAPDVAVRALVSLEEDLMQSLDRKSTRLNSSHTVISYAVFCLKKKKEQKRACSRESHLAIFFYGQCRCSDCAQRRVAGKCNVKTLGRPPSAANLYHSDHVFIVL